MTFFVIQILCYLLWKLSRAGNACFLTQWPVTCLSAVTETMSSNSTYTFTAPSTHTKKNTQWLIRRCYLYWKPWLSKSAGKGQRVKSLRQQFSTDQSLQLQCYLEAVPKAQSEGGLSWTTAFSRENRVRLSLSSLFQTSLQKPIR